MKRTREVKGVGTRWSRGRGYQVKTVELVPHRGASRGVEGIVNGVQDIENRHTLPVVYHHG